MAESLNLRKLSGEITRIRIPQSDGETAQWDEVANEIQKLSIRHARVWAEWTLNVKQAPILRDYLRVSWLTYECVELATVSDRGAFERRIVHLSESEEGSAVSAERLES